MLGAFKGQVDVRADVLLAEHGVEAGLVEHGLNGRVHTREHHLDALGLRHQTEVRQVVDTR